MNTWARFLIVGVLAAAVAGVFALKRFDRAAVPPPVPTPGFPAETATAQPPSKAPMPRLVDLGAGKCIPCKLMAPILDDLKKDFASHFEVQFIDVWENPDVGKEHGVEMIPTQIFYDAAGKELYRHTGFLGKEDILAKWNELGVDTGAAGSGIVREEPVQADTRPLGGLLPAGLRRQPDEPQSLAGPTSVHDRTADHHRPGPRRQNEAQPRADREGVQAGRMQVTPPTRPIAMKALRRSWKWPLWLALVWNNCSPN